MKGMKHAPKGAKGSDKNGTGNPFASFNRNGDSRSPGSVPKDNHRAAPKRKMKY